MDNCRSNYLISLLNGNGAIRANALGRHDEHTSRAHNRNFLIDCEFGVFCIVDRGWFIPGSQTPWGEGQHSGGVLRVALSSFLINCVLMWVFMTIYFLVFLACEYILTSHLLSHDNLNIKHRALMHDKRVQTSFYRDGYMLEPIFEEEFSCSRCGLRLYWQPEEGLYEVPKPVQAEITEAKETRPRLGNNNDKREMVSSTKIIKTIQEYRREASY